MARLLKIRFTLIELLVVAAIIAVLISLLLPALASARNYGKNLTCMGHLKNIGLMAMSYADDYAGVLPPYKADYASCGVVGNTTSKVNLDVMWKLLVPYGLNGRVAQCPFKSYYTNWKSYWMKSSSSRSSYFYELAAGSYYVPSTYKVRRLSDAGASTTCIIVDTATDAWKNSSTDPSGDWWVNNHRYPNGGVESQNQLYLDGHVIHVKAPKTSKRLGLGW